MRKDIIITEALITLVIPEKVLRIADECLVESRLIESRRKSSQWNHEFEIRGEVGKVEKFLKRIRSFELGT